MAFMVMTCSDSQQGWLQPFAYYNTRYCSDLNINQSITMASVYALLYANVCILTYCHCHLRMALVLEAKCKPAICTRRKVRGLPKQVGIVLWRPDGLVNVAD